MAGRITISDPTLRDGNHAIGHTLSTKDITTYCRAIDGCGIDIVEVGHGNGSGASSLQLGRAKQSDQAMLECARKNLACTKLGIHLIPGFAKLSDIDIAAAAGVDVIRVAAHCTEADITQPYIEYARNLQLSVFGVLMMTHMASAERLLLEATKQQSYGAQAVVLMDSAGNYVERDVHEKIGLLCRELVIPVGFHAHNNLGLAVANTLAAVEAGATIVDGTLCGFGAGAGNTQLEVLVAVLTRYGCTIGADLLRLLGAIELLGNLPVTQYPVIKTSNVISGFYGVCAGFERHVTRAAKTFGVPPETIYRELAKCNAVAGQEDLIIEVASRLGLVAETSPNKMVS